MTELTVYRQQDALLVQLESDDGSDALEPRLVVAGVRQEAVRPPLAAVVDPTQSATPRQTRVAREQEVGGDVTSADVELDVWRRIATERDAPQSAWSSVDKVNGGQRRRTIRDEVVVRYHDPLHRHCKRASVIDFHPRTFGN